MSGIFDKYLGMINGSKSATYSHSMPNTGKYVQTVDGKEVYVPMKNRRSSSTSSDSSIGSAGSFSRNSSVSSATMDPNVIEEIETKTVKIVKTAPNNRVNF